MSSTITIPQSPPPGKLQDVLSAIVYGLEAAHFHLNAGGTPASAPQFRNAQNADERIARAARLAMEVLMESGFDRAPMCQPWPEVMPDGWNGPTCWAENDTPRVEHEPEPVEYDLGDCDTFERTVDSVFTPEEFDAVPVNYAAILDEVWERGR